MGRTIRVSTVTALVLSCILGESPFVIRAGDDCCTIVGLDAKRQSITALERSTGKRFTFSVNDAAVFKTAALCGRFEAPLAEVQKGATFAADFGGAAFRKPCCTLTTTIGGPGDALGVRGHQAEGVEVILNELKRTSGDTLTARWEYCNGSKQSLRFKAEGCVGMGCTYTLAEGVELLDPATRTKHGVLRVEGREAIAERYSQDKLRVAPNQILKTWAKFPAPPESSARVTVVIPGASEPFEAVPIGK